MAWLWRGFPFWQSLSGNGVELSAVVINDMLQSRLEML